MMIIKIPQNVHKISVWVVWMSFTCEIKIDFIKSEPHYVEFLFRNLLHSDHFWLLDIWQIIGNVFINMTWGWQGRFGDDMGTVGMTREAGRWPGRLGDWDDLGTMGQHMSSPRSSPMSGNDLRWWGHIYVVPKVILSIWDYGDGIHHLQEHHQCLGDYLGMLGITKGWPWKYHPHEVLPVLVSSSCHPQVVSMLSPTRFHQKTIPI